MASVKARHQVGLGLLGSGVVGEAIQEIVFNDLKGQVGSDLQLDIRKIYTRRPKEKKWFSSHPSLFTTKAEEVIDDPGVDIVVEVLGFQHEAELSILRDYILRALERGKSVVTSD
jgi:homoserine dehydrogenase